MYGAAERERAANEKAQFASLRQASLIAALEAAREEASEARRTAEVTQQALINAQSQSQRLEDQLEKV